MPENGCQNVKRAVTSSKGRPFFYYTKLQAWCIWKENVSTGKSSFMAIQSYFRSGFDLFLSLKRSPNPEWNRTSKRKAIDFTTFLWSVAFRWYSWPSPGYWNSHHSQRMSRDRMGDMLEKPSFWGVKWAVRNGAIRSLLSHESEGLHSFIVLYLT